MKCSGARVDRTWLVGRSFVGRGAAALPRAPLTKQRSRAVVGEAQRDERGPARRRQRVSGGVVWAFGVRPRMRADDVAHGSSWLIVSTLHIHQPTLGDPLCRGHASVWCGAACGFGNAMQVQESSLKQRLWFIPGPPASLATRQRGARALRARAARAPRPFQPALRRDWHALPLRKRGPHLCSFSSGSHCRMRCRWIRGAASCPRRRAVCEPCFR